MNVTQVWNVRSRATTKADWRRRRPSSSIATAASLICGSSCCSCCTTRTTVRATSSGPTENAASSSWSTPRPSHISGDFTRTNQTWTTRRWDAHSGNTSQTLIIIIIIIKFLHWVTLTSASDYNYIQYIHVYMQTYVNIWAALRWTSNQ